MIPDLTIEDFKNSIIAQKYSKIDNTIPEEIIPNAIELLNFVNEMQRLFGIRFQILLGYASKELLKQLPNKEKNHNLGYSIDIYHPRFRMFKELLKSYLLNKSFHECRIDSNMRGSWIHFTLKNENNKQKKILNIK